MANEDKFNKLKLEASKAKNPRTLMFIRREGVNEYKRNRSKTNKQKLRSLDNLIKRKKKELKKSR